MAHRGAALLCALAAALPIAACGSAAPAGTALPEIDASPDLSRATPPPDAPVAELTAGFAGAGFDLLGSQSEDANAVVSPFSIGHALLMVRDAADDDTASAIGTVLDLPAGVPAHEAWNAVDRAIAADAAQVEDLDVTSASAVWPDTSADLDEAWPDLLALHHGTAVTPLPLQEDSEGSRDVINEWAAERTEGLITEPLPAGFIHPNTVLVLTDALYFAAPWQTPFGKYGPEPGTFTRGDGSTVEVDFLHELELAGPRGAGDGFVGAEIPYAGGDFSMLVLAPDEGRFGEVRDRLDQEMLDEVDSTFATGPYELFLPPWTTATTLDLLPWLEERGIASGHYPGIDPDAFLDAAVHAADITVDEWGTVAAAVTALGFAESGPPEPELTVRADRPYLYVIRHVPTGAVLFAGQVADPSA